MAINIITNAMIKIDRLAKYFPEDFGWNISERVKMDDITFAINNGQIEEVKMFNPNISMPYEWHIGRIIHFINHPKEIEYIEIGNLDDGHFILATPIIIEGHHRFIAAMWLHSHGKLEEIYCTYSGRSDILYYLSGDGRKPKLSKWIEKEKMDSMDILNCCIENSNKEFYYELNTGKLIFGSEIKRAKKLSETVAKDMVEMFRKMFPDDEYKIISEEIKLTEKSLNAVVEEVIGNMVG